MKKVFQFVGWGLIGFTYLGIVSCVVRMVISMLNDSALTGSVTGCIAVGMTTMFMAVLVYLSGTLFVLAFKEEVLNIKTK